MLHKFDIATLLIDTGVVPLWFGNINIQYGNNNILDVDIVLDLKIVGQ